MSEVSAVFVGSAGSGKTTYLAALWSTVKNAPKGQYPRLSGSLPRNTQLLDEIEHALLAGTSVHRTRRDTGEEVRLSLKLDAESDVEVHYIDVAGESISSVVFDRQAPGLLMTSLAEATATMLFLHPDDTKQMPMLAHPVAVHASGSTSEADTTGSSAPVIVEEASDEQIWREASSDIRHVEMLQLCQEAAQQPGTPIAVIVSAWDLVAVGKDVWTDPDPTTWLKKELPLLTQYLEAHEDRHPWRVFGVSAQGADNDDEAAIKALLSARCAERTVVVGSRGWTREISAPIEWIRSVSASAS
jgi:hypothetical protein